MSKFFTTTKKGEIHDLRQDMLSANEDTRMDAVKRVIAAMTEGKDVSMLFTDVLNCMQTSNLKLKKLVYLYVMNYAKSQPDLAILAVNTFCKDATDANPMVRALAIRTMSCIRVQQIAEYLSQPLALALKDGDPYVRKTAAIAVAKLFDSNPEAVVTEGFLDTLRDMLGDKNPMVVSNAVAALSEISASAAASGDKSAKLAFRVDATVLLNLLSALNECHEWGQVFILDCLASYTPHDRREAEGICERVAVRFNHSNSAVVLGAIKVVLMCLPHIDSADVVKTYMRKLSPPLITLLSSSKESEIQYVALRNVSLVVQRYPDVLRSEIRIFFCKYNDPIYVKLEKLELMNMLVNDRNVDTVLSELREYATTADVEFVRKSVRAIGRIAIKLAGAADRCVKVLLDLIKMKVNYVVQESVIVIKDIFRKYPNKYESIIATLCSNLETLDDPEAKASMVWIIGEYADRIDNAGELLARFVDSFADEDSVVQMQLLTAVVKLFLRKPSETQQMVQTILTKATEMTDDPDLRDRGFMYWRLLSADPEVAKAVVLSGTDKPSITDTSSDVEPELLKQLIAHLGSLSSIFHKSPSAFVTRTPANAAALRAARAAAAAEDDDNNDDDRDDHDHPDDTKPSSSPAASTTGGSSLLDLDFLGSAPAAVPSATPASAAAAPAAAPAAASNTMDLLMDLLPTTSAPAPAPAAAAPAATTNQLMDLFGTPAPAPAPAPAVASLPVLLPSTQGDGMELCGAIVNTGGNTFVMNMQCTNRGAAPLGAFAMQFNRNRLGLTPSTNPAFGTVNPGATATATVPLQVQPTMVNPACPDTTVQIAVKNSTGKIYYFTCRA